MHIQTKVWLVTGCSTGFGKEMARIILQQGDFLVATSRTADGLAELTAQFEGQLLTLQLDLTDAENVARVVASALRQFGRIDVLVNNAGYGLTGAIEEATDEEIEDQFGVNVFGTLRLTRAVLPQMRQQGSGYVLVLSSVSGLVSSPGMGYYNGSKYAVEGIFEALALEAAPLGIRVTLVEPGPFRTEFAGTSMKHTQPLPAYEATVGATRAQFEAINGQQAGDPVKAAQVIVGLAELPTPPPRIVLGKAGLNRLRTKLQALQNLVNEWEQVTLSVDFPS